MNIIERVPGLHHSKTTSTYASWHTDEVELRSFLLTSTEGMGSWFKAKETEAEQAVAHLDPEYAEGDEAYTHFMDTVGIFWETYWYQLAAAIVKDGFTLFEVFLEESADGLLRFYGSGLKNLATENSWYMRECNQFFKSYLGFEILTPELEDIQWIRNKLAHLRDSLRTDEGKTDFAEKLERLGVGGDETTPEEKELLLPHYLYGRELAFSKSLVLTPLEAWRILDIIREHADQLTRALHSIQYGGMTTQALEDLRAGTTVRSSDGKLLHVPVIKDAITDD